MLIKKPSDIPSSEITPKPLYVNRRKFLVGAGVAGAGLLAGKAFFDLTAPEQKVFAAKLNYSSNAQFSTNEKQTPFKDVTHYNNYYEFGTEKEQPAEEAK